ncbi:MAG: GntR family transcriptional regulator [Candidatus Hydrogenedentes bacterium]|nr:GntR family transcriptional regulator [Candidatus Hydrogenedentota bacterium]
MFDQVNIRSSVAVYVQIENLVRFAVASGRLKVDDQLPSVLKLTEQLGLNPNTITKAYRDLEVMGIVYTRRGIGVYIKKGADTKCRDAVCSQIVGRIHEAVSEAKAAGMSAKEVRSLVAKLYGAVGEPYGIDEVLVRGLAKVK